MAFCYHFNSIPYCETPRFLARWKLLKRSQKATHHRPFATSLLFYSYNPVNQKNLIFSVKISEAKSKALIYMDFNN